MREKVVLIIAFFWIFGLIIGLGTAESEAVGPIKIGMTQDQSGPLAVLGKRSVNSTLLAIEEINAAGGVLGRKIEITVLDDKCDPELATSNAKRLIEKENIVALIGSSSSGCCIALSKVAEEYRVPYIIHESTTHKTTEPLKKYTFRLVNIDREQGISMLIKAKELGAKRVGLIYLDAAWGRDVGKAIQVHASKYGLKVVKVVANAMKVEDLTPHLLKLKAAKPDVIIALEYEPQSILVATGLRQLGWMPKYSVINSSAVIAGPMKSHPEVLEEFWGISPMNPWKPACKAWLDKYNARYNDRPSAEYGLSHTYDTVHLFVKAMQIANSTDRDAIRDALEQIKDYDCMSGIAGSRVSFSATDHDGLTAEDCVAFQSRGGLAYFDSNPKTGLTP